MNATSKITTIEIDDSLDRLSDWDFFDEKVIGKFSGFKAAAGNILGIRRRIIDRDSIYDEKKGPHPAHLRAFPHRHRDRDLSADEFPRDARRHAASRSA